MRGNYTDMSETTLEATVHSMNQMQLVLEPNETFKYSNAALGLVGRILEVVTREPFADHVQHIVEDILEMKKTSAIPRPHIMKDLCHGYMWSYEDRREANAPMFELGEAPAGSMFSTVEDLANFIVCLINKGTYKGKTLIKPETMREMWRPQFPDAPIGIGFVTMDPEGIRMVRADYGLDSPFCDFFCCSFFSILVLWLIFIRNTNSFRSFYVEIDLQRLAMLVQFMATAVNLWSVLILVLASSACLRSIPVIPSCQTST